MTEMTTREIAKLATARDRAKEQYTRHQLRHAELRAELLSVTKELARAGDPDLMARAGSINACLSLFPDIVAESADVYATAFLAHARAKRAHTLRTHNDAVLEIDRAMDGFTALRNVVEQFAHDDDRREQIEAHMREKGLAAAPHRERQTQAQAELMALDSQCHRLLGDAVDRVDERHVQRFVSRHRARVAA